MSDQIVIKPSKTFLIIMAIVSGGLTLFLRSMLGDYGIIGALAEGGLIGKCAFATVVFALCTIACPLAMVKPVRRVTVNHDGITEKSIGIDEFVPWREILSYETADGGVAIKTPNGVVVFGEFMHSSKKIVLALESYKNTVSPALYTQRMGRLFN